MALKQSRMIALGLRAPNFALPDVVSGRTVALADFAVAPALLVAFICNPLPLCQARARRLRRVRARVSAEEARDRRDQRQRCGELSAPEAMAREAKKAGFTFPYLYDESQATARAFEAICAPDLFLFDRERKLAYRGRFDASRLGSNVAVTGADLGAAADALLAGRAVPAEQAPSMDCSIKWKPGHALAYA